MIYNDEGKLETRDIILKNQKQYERFANLKGSYLTSRKGRTQMFLDDLVDGETYYTDSTFSALVRIAVQLRKHGCSCVAQQ